MEAGGKLARAVNRTLEDKGKEREWQDTQALFAGSAGAKA